MHPNFVPTYIGGQKKCVYCGRPIKHIGFVWTKNQEIMFHPDCLQHAMYDFDFLLQPKFHDYLYREFWKSTYDIFELVWPDRIDMYNEHFHNGLL